MRITLPWQQCHRIHKKKPLLNTGRAGASAALETVRRELDRLESLDRAADAETYCTLIRQCTLARAIPEGRRLRAHISAHGCRDSYLLNLLVLMFGRFGSLADAHAIFDSIAEKNCYSWNIMVSAFAQNGELHRARFVFDQMPLEFHSAISWTALITAYGQNGQAAAAIELFALMDLDGIRADKITFVSAIDACSSLRRLDLGTAVHVEARERGTELHYAVATALLSMYGKFRHVDASKEIFDRMEERNMVTWTAMITAYAQNALLVRAVEIYGRIPEWNVVCVTALMSALAQNGHLREAEELFASMEDRNSVSWSTMLAAYNQHGDPARAIEIFDAMEAAGIRPDRNCFVGALDACASLGNLELGRRIHREIARCEAEESNAIVANALVAMYGRCGSEDDARAVFDRARPRSLLSWNAIIGAYAQNSRTRDAEAVLDRMPQRDLASWNALLVADARAGDLESVERVLAGMEEHDIVSRNARVLALALCEREREAIHAFRSLDLDGFQLNRVSFLAILEACSSRASLGFGLLVQACAAESIFAADVHVGTSLVAMFARCERCDEAELAFSTIARKNLLAWTAILSAYAQSARVDPARRVFDLLPQRDLAAWNAMLSGYAIAGDCAAARELFDAMPQRNSTSWTGMMSAYAERRCSIEALLLLRAMDLAGARPTKTTFLKTLEAIAGGVSASIARSIHARAIESGLASDPQIGVGLLNLYEKSGSLASAKLIFDDLAERSVVAWSIMISAYSGAGYPRISLELFAEMLLSGVPPTEITFVNLLAACSHGGFLHHSRLFFLAMVADFGLAPIVDNYVCLVDILGRTGQLCLARELLETMPYEPNDIAWTSLLSSCKTQGDGERGASVGDQVIGMKPGHSGPYRLVWNVCVEGGGGGGEDAFFD